MYKVTEGGVTLISLTDSCSSDSASVLMAGRSKRLEKSEHVIHMWTGNESRHYVDEQGRQYKYKYIFPSCDNHISYVEVKWEHGQKAKIVQCHAVSHTTMTPDQSDCTNNKCCNPTGWANFLSLYT